MAQEVTNFARFYASFNRLPCTGDKETTKQEIVMQWTGNRTSRDDEEGVRCLL